jgi:hypothetical protein
MKNIIFFGASGRIGSLLMGSDELSGLIYYAKRENKFQIGSDVIDEDDLLARVHNQPVQFIDFSVDYKSADCFKSHEAFKKKLLIKLLRGSSLEFYMGMSSGAAQFPIDIIEDDFYKLYATSKTEHKKFLSEIERPIFFPQLFTLIGKESFRFKTTGWVDVVEKIVSKSDLVISDPYELRSWVSERTLQESMVEFLRNPKSNFFGSILDGNFSLSELVDIVSHLYGFKTQYRISKRAKWLPIAYVNQYRTEHNGSRLLDQVIADLLNKG